MKSLLIRPALLALVPFAALAQEPVFEPVVLPALEGGRPDEADPGAERPVLNVLPDGTIVAGGKRIYDPADEDASETLRGHLARMAAAMGKDELGALTVASGRILIRADVHAPWRTTQRLLEACVREDVLIARFDFAVRDPELGPRLDERGLPIPDPARAQVLPFELPTDADEVVEELPEAPPGGERGGRKPKALGDTSTPEPVERVEVIVRVRNAGTRIGANRAPWSGAGPYTVTGRKLEWSAGPRRTIDFEQLEDHLVEIRKRNGPKWLVIDARQHTTSGEALAVFAAARKHGYAPISFVGAYE